MAIRRTSNNSINNAVKLSTGFASAAIPNPPTIGTATATSDVAATVEYTAAVLGATASTFTATSNPGSVTGTGSSPITVTGLTASTAYTFTVTAGNANGTSAASSASNSITTSAPLNSYESIATVTVGSGGAANVEFTSIPGTYKHLQIRGIANNGETSGWNNQAMQINADTSTSYSYHYVAGTGASATAGAQANGTSINDIFRIPATSTGYFGSFIIDILDYTSTSKNKTIRSFNGGDGNGNGWVGLHSGLYYATPAAVTSVKFISSVGNFGQYSHFALYGIKI